ncbi:hypothetical protein [Pectobacterium parmentieri]|uniref:Uncharacterized protein n=1 Tax=Pectobacterium parmentieri TaxID=1905730 RepID=A0A8B3FI06_PECPM|nr:hypothetical protein [Pectobacterium parmentieri]AOR57388.1 hypothetical protein A8F97_00460 [Pectobacterium parmentieri]AYH11567.1 hypothetical protein C5E24_18695 [Pectobacterium parmentieri]AYH17716.1 hypothetical protein C5E22_04075 [Pectobacterium parmentieri]AYH37847.1 hypothetical protein C5E17_18440 [Pectobacterium parmentieri]AZS58078.1 hypothetical protein C5E18_19130 [Pectobacterium parmentieri]
MPQPPRFFGPILYYAASWLAASAILTLFALINFYTLEPTDVGGTLFGGMFGAIFDLIYWSCAALGFCFLALFRLSGWRVALILAGLVQIGISALWRIQYWQDYENEELILSPTPGELHVSILVGVAMTTIGIVKYRHAQHNSRPHSPVRSKTVTQKTRSTNTITAKTIAAFVLIALYLVLPLHLYLREPLPYCAFSPSGQQLSICLGEDDERIIVE